MRSLVRPVSKGWRRAYGISGLWVGLNMTTDWALGVKFPFAESTIPQRIDLLRWKTPITSMRIRKSALCPRPARSKDRTNDIDSTWRFPPKAQKKQKSRG